MTRHPEPDWVPLLVPDMPSPQALMPWLERMHAARHYSNFGPLVRELEAEFARCFAIPAQGIATVANATLGLELVLQALELAPGSHILLPAFTFVATATAVMRAGHVPVLADVDPDTWLLTPAIARTACQQVSIDAVMPVATFGMPHDMPAWRQFETDTGLPVVIDAAAAYGSQWLQGVDGTLVFSLHATKSLPAGEGGLIVSTRPGLAEKVRQLSNFGINLDPAASLPVGALAAVGTNAKMSEYHAAIGLASLCVWEQHALERRALHEEMVQELSRLGGACLAWQRPGADKGLVAPTVLCIRLGEEAARTEMEQRCRSAGITTRRWYQPLLQSMPALWHGCKVLETPHAEVLSQTLLGFPFFLGISEGQKTRIYKAMSEWIR
ncbi:DegT/DnrJ/EryC1/StrS family aminotransferase [Delftia acidovorans]|uniref:DegT/DnrJ/EryC1/StrS family aminotransferase n=1 Tax=Delftia acidovorans TaxID=80866 RepID=UPI000BCDA654|nr:DegT/DnrJ/EryC1/StrS family aminotransferase [Delftia acidovorans]SOE39032.1 dTDP-4-amino-4,6-dideoxygalactose transaminase [Delftia acidovorans]